jgi:hypothetical protein
MGRDKDGFGFIDMFYLIIRQQESLDYTIALA